MALKQQYITDEKGKKIAVILPMSEYEKILEEKEELEDIKLYDKTKKEDKCKRILLNEYLKKRNKANG